MHRSSLLLPAFSFAAMLLLAACAEVKVTPIVAGDAKTPGVRFYRPEPYLLVTKETPKPAGDAAQPAANPQPTYTVKLIWLPNYVVGYAINVTPGLGTSDTTIKLQDGWQLVELGSKIDPKVPETITAVSGLLKEAATAGIFSAQGEMKPGLYRLEFDADGHVSSVNPVTMK